MRTRRPDKELLFSTVLLCAFIAAKAQPAPVEMLDVDCLVNKPVKCVVTTPAMTTTYNIVIPGGTSTKEDSFPNYKECLSSPRTYPEECKRKVYLASDIDILLTDQTRRFRQSQFELCKRVAADPAKCGDLVASEDKGTLK